MKYIAALVTLLSLIGTVGGAGYWAYAKDDEISNNTAYRLRQEIGERIQWMQSVMSKYGCSYGSA